MRGDGDVVPFFGAVLLTNTLFHQIIENVASGGKHG
jgi:hypothetical protein